MGVVQTDVDVFMLVVELRLTQVIVSEIGDAITI